MLAEIGKLFTNALPWVEAGVGLLSTVKGLQAAKAVKKEGRYNASLWREEAEASWRAYEDRANIMRHEQRLFRGQQVAGYGKAGVMLAGSAMDVLADTAYQQSLDQVALRNQAEAERRQRLMSANMEEFQAEQTSAATRTQAVTSFSSTLLGSSLFRTASTGKVIS